MQTQSPLDTRTPVRSAPFRRRWVRMFAVVIVAAGLAVGWYLFSPLFLNRTVVEDFPVATTVAAPQPAAPAGPGADLDEPETTEAAAAESPVEPEFEPVVLATGEFMDADSFHRGSGTATIYELEDGSRILRLEDFDVTNGPDLHVFVSPTAVPETSDDVMGVGYVDLGELKGNRGDQNYDLPPDVVLPEGEFSIVIYCVPFHVVFATATVSG